ncbi:hypothetical protein GJ629_03655 [Halapricum sp. CBA1109]|uniref:DUF7289 family protein n=1 Tax=Halapricum sp. CBA1109 TaxID=2668068 RepID=UPI0012FC1BBE|nr:hypothetical protein [Halapricum sp. CBA1109]MUV89107.1 hypothetical protein [Halapricum sp. CBA1109]
MPRGDDRAVSGLVGYMLVFTIVLTSGVVLTTAGLTALLDSGESGLSPTTERDIQRVDSGVGSLVDGGPRREVWLGLDGGRLAYGDRYSVTVSVGDGNGSTPEDRIEATGRPLTYAAGGSRATYGSGLAATGEGATLRERPRIRLSDSQAVLDLSVFEQASRSPSVVSGSDVPVVLERTGAETLERAADTADGAAAERTVTVTVDGPLARAWGTYFEGHDRLQPRDVDGDGATEYTSDSDGDGEVDRASATVTSERVFVRTVTVSVALDRAL